MKKGCVKRKNKERGAEEEIRLVLRRITEKLARARLVHSLDGRLIAEDWNEFYMLENEARAVLGKKPGEAAGRRILSKDIGYKCGGCNWESSTAWYLEGDDEPEEDPEDEGRLKNGLCSDCFLEFLSRSEARVRA